jgi:kynurenine formamidase
LFAVTSTAALASAQPLDLRTARAVDLSHSFDEKTIYWPNAPSTFELKRLHYGPTEGGYFYSANSLCTPEHGGTHLDAPIHFAEGKPGVDQVPLDKLIGPARSPTSRGRGGRPDSARASTT